MGEAVAITDLPLVWYFGGAVFILLAIIVALAYIVFASGKGIKARDIAIQSFKDYVDMYVEREAVIARHFENSKTMTATDFLTITNDVRELIEERRMHREAID